MKRALWVLLIASNLAWAALYYWTDPPDLSELYDAAPVCGLLGQ